MTDQSDYRDIFGAAGPLAAALPDYAFRPEQAAMARWVGRSLAQLEPLIVEAGTGTGKTFAYLVPVLLSGRSVIISTGTRTLQDQLFHRDVPLLAKALGLPVKIALLKGRANYLCLHRLDLATQQRSLLPRERGSGRDLAAISRWALGTRSGDLAELVAMPEQSALRPLVTSTRENCLGQECPRFTHCHVFEARRTAQAADVVIVNHHLLLADLALKDAGFGDLLPGTDAVILDEAHQIPDIAAQFFGQSWSSRQAQLLLRDTAAELLANKVQAAGISAELKSLESELTRLRLNLASSGARVDFGVNTESFMQSLSEFAAKLTALGTELEGLGAGAGTAACGRRAIELAAELSALRDVSEDTGLKWIETSAHAFELQFTPFEIAERLRGYVEARPCAWVFTSATLAVGEDFSHFATRIGLPDARCVRIESPFDYREQALIFLPKGLPEPQAPGYTAEFLSACAPLLRAAGGRAFLLFTSYRALHEGVTALARLFPDPPFPVLVQGEAPREALLARFRELGNAVLLATGSFWEGVDVKGEALVIVAIDKLPFAVPDDPLLRARLEGIRRRGGNPFVEYQLPQAVLALKQGVGRLIRDFDDFGVIVIGDPRLATKSYGRMFRASLPPAPVVHTAEPAAEFLRAELRRRHPMKLAPAGT
jgi:ATP-dependent DNA helicase DinG